MANTNNVTVNGKVENMEDQNMENNKFYDENDVNAQENITEENDSQEQQEPTPEAPKAKEKKGILPVLGGFAVGAVTGVVATCAFFAFKGKKAPKVSTDAITDNVIDFAKELVEKKAKEA